MKKQLQTIPTLVLLMLVSLGLQAQTYHEGDSLALVSIRDNNFTDDNLLEWTDQDPGNWLGIEWNDDVPKRVIQISLRKDGSDGNGYNENNNSWPVSFDFETKFDGYIASGVNSALDGVIDFSAFAELVVLNLRNQDEITAINVQGLDQLQYFAFTNSNLTKLDLSNLPSLIDARMSNSELLDSLDISNCPSLIKIKAAWDTYNLTYVNVQGSTNLRHLNLKQHNLTSLDVSGLTQLNKLAISDGSIETLVGTEDLSSLFALGISNNNIDGSVDVSNFDYDKLYKFSMGDNQIDEIVGLETVLAMDEIYNLNAGNNNLTLTDIVHIDNFEGNVDNKLNDNGTDQTRYGNDFLVVPASLDYSDEALIAVDGIDVMTTFTLFKFVDGEDDDEIENNTTGLFSFADDTDAGEYYVTMENSGITLTTNTTTVLEAVSSVIIVSITEADFEIWQDSTTTAILTVENLGGSSFDITDIELPVGFSTGDFTTTQTLDAGTSQDFTITFTSEDAGVFGGDLLVSNNATTGDSILVLSGVVLEAVAVIDLALEQEFGEVLVGESSSQTLTVSNTGILDLEVTDILMPEGFSINATTVSLAAGATQNFTVRFRPNSNTQVIETYAGSIEVVTDANEGGRYANVLGTGIAFSVIISSIDAPFGSVSVGGSQQQTLTITNASAVPIDVNDIDVPDGFSIDGTSATLDGEDSQTFTVTFEPTEAGTFDGDIIVDSDASDGVSSVAVSGTGISSVLTASVSAFGDVEVGESATQELTISNASGVDIVVSDITLPTGFTIDATTTTVIDGGSKTFEVTFSPTAEITYSGDIVITSDASSSELTVAVSGTGLTLLGANDDLQQLAMYPNPTTDGIIYINGITNSMSLSIYSVSGNLIKQVELSAERNQIDISELLQGMYIIRSEEQDFSRSFVVTQ